MKLDEAEVSVLCPWSAQLQSTVCARCELVGMAHGDRSREVFDLVLVWGRLTCYLANLVAR